MKKNTVTQGHIDYILSQSEVQVKEAFGKTVIVACKLPNGFVIVEASSCVDPANFSLELGKGICMERITNRIWELEGYLLQNRLYETSDPTSL